MFRTRTRRPADDPMGNSLRNGTLPYAGADADADAGADVIGETAAAAGAISSPLATPAAVVG